MKYSKKYNCYATKAGLIYVYYNGKLLLKTIREHNNTSGYQRVQFNQKVEGIKQHRNILVHRIVWDAFKGEVPEGYEIDHIDFNRSNNCIDNLRLLSIGANRRRKKKLEGDDQ